MNYKLLLSIVISFFQINRAHAAAVAKEEAKVEITEGLLEQSLPPLVETLYSGNLEDVRAAIDWGENVNAQDAQGRTALYFAAQEDKPDFIKLLLSSPDVEIDKSDPDGLTPLSIAVINKSAEAVKALFSRCKILPYKFTKCPNINAKDKRNNTPLSRAIIQDDKDLTKFLLDHDTNTKNAYKIYTDLLKVAKSPEIKQMLADKIQDRTAKARAIVSNTITEDQRFDLVEKGGFDLDYIFPNGSTILHHLTSRNLIDKLLKLGADPNIKDSKGNTLLRLAANRNLNDKDMISFLVESGADINSQDINLRTLLHQAVDLGAFGLVKLLISMKANPDAQDINGDTPLHIASYKASYIGVLDAMQSLIEAGADDSTINNRGKTAIDLAREGRGDDKELVIKALNDYHAVRKQNAANLLESLMELRGQLNLPDPLAKLITQYTYGLRPTAG